MKTSQGKACKVKNGVRCKVDGRIGHIFSAYAGKAVVMFKNGEMGTYPKADVQTLPGRPITGL